MTHGAQRGQRRLGLLVVAVLLIVVGGVCMMLGDNDFSIRSLGIAALLASVYCVRKSQRGSASPSPRERADANGLRGWKPMLLSVAAFLGAFAYLYYDACHGYQRISSVYIFAGVTMACAVYWGYRAMVAAKQL